MIIHKISKYEDDRPKIEDSRALNDEFQYPRWPPVGHFESDFHEFRFHMRFYDHTQYIQI